MLDQIERDLKTALLAGDKATVEVLKTLKTAIQYEAVAKSVKPEALDKQQLHLVVARESKKRLEAAQIYESAGETERRSKELAEKTVIDKYLPEQLSEAETATIVEDEITKLNDFSPKDMGRIIAAVIARTQGAADGAMIARLVKQSLEQKTGD